MTRAFNEATTATDCSSPYTRFARSTERLHIRAWGPDDAESAFKMYGDPEVAKYLTGQPEESVESQRKMLVTISASYSRFDRPFGSFPLIRKTDGELVGAILLKPLPRTENLDQWRAFRDGSDILPDVHEIEVGWHLRREAWGHGYATEAARCVVEVGFVEMGLDEIYCVLYNENKKSWRVAERLHMKHLGQTDKFYGVSLEHFVLTRKSWEAGREPT
ncbi:MAG: GNAT family N-acetyltransferase [Chthonomonadaceae bacterium]|nr:GNAT family N-acetyltransferase [Chthonomonadaceae bacterium]